MAANQPIIIIKKKVDGHGAHGAAWKVAYADFVTAMMALFMVLWLLSQTEETEIKKLSEYFRTGVFSGAPSILEGGSGLTEQGFLEKSAKAPNEQLWTAANAERLKAELVGIMRGSADLTKFQDVVTVIAKPEGVLIEFREKDNEDVLFSSSSAKLQPALVEILTNLAPALEESGYHVRIEGHTDARPFPTGAGRTNWDLSFERADAARVVLTQAGLAESAIVGVYALGSSALLDPKNPTSAVNRRLTLLAIPKEAAAPPKKVRKSNKLLPKNKAKLDAIKNKTNED
jgi:chemotaxis protein MotB